MNFKEIKLFLGRSISNLILNKKKTIENQVEIYFIKCS